MKKKMTCIMVSISLGMLLGCQAMPDIRNSLTSLGEKQRTYEKIDPAALPPISQLAILAVELEKNGLIDHVPFISIHQNGKNLLNDTDYSQFNTRNIAIIEFRQSEDGMFLQRMLVESADALDRIDVSEISIMFSVRDPDENEIQQTAEFLTGGMKRLDTINKQARADLAKAVVEYQRAKGLTADGIAGKKTMETMARDLPILDIKEMTSTILYPQRPAAELYVVPFETVEKNVEQFNKGFESIQAVKKNSMTLEKIKTAGQAKSRFVLFVYFFDRANPDVPIRLSLSPNERKWSSKHLTPIRYANRGIWPVMIETLCIDKEFGSAKLFANLFLKYNCVSSFRIL
jgi:hypothetical protein